MAMMPQWPAGIAGLADRPIDSGLAWRFASFALFGCEDLLFEASIIITHRQTGLKREGET